MQNIGAKVISSEQLLKLAKETLVAAGASEENACTVADHLVSANLSGTDTHGVWQLPGYIQSIRLGEIIPDAIPVVARESPTTVLVRGRWTFGQVAATFAMEKALEKAMLNGVAVAGVVECHHIGRLGHYAESRRSRSSFMHRRGRPG